MRGKTHENLTTFGRSIPLKLSWNQLLSAIYYIDTDEIPGFLLLLKNHIFIARSEDTIFIFHAKDTGVAMVTNINFDFLEQKIISIIVFISSL